MTSIINEISDGKVVEFPNVGLETKSIWTKLKSSLRLKTVEMNFSENLQFNSLEERIRNILEFLEIDLSSDLLKKVIVSYPLNEIKNHARAHILLERENEYILEKIMSIPVVTGDLQIQKYKQIHIVHDKSVKYSRLDNIKFLSEYLIKAFDGHDKFEDSSHDVSVGEKTKFLMQNMIEIHPDFEAILLKRPDYIDFARNAAQLHDVGKIFIPYEVLNKPEKFDEEEWKLMKKHTDFGSLLMKGIPGLELAECVTYHHHEKVDGTGYNGLLGDEIPLVSRFTAISDIFDALTSKRSYKEAYTPEIARDIIFNGYDDGKGVFSQDAFDKHIRNFLLNRENWIRFVEFHSTLPKENLFLKQTKI